MRTTLLGALGLLLLAPATQAQDWELDPTFGSVELGEGFLPDPHAVELTAGGGTTPAVSGCDFGSIAEAPDYDVHYETTGATTLYIYATSGSDTTILVNTPSQNWVCDDDSYGGENPIVVIPNAESGLYDIWVGTFGEDATEATLFVSEVDPRE